MRAPLWIVFSIVSSFLFTSAVAAIRLGQTDDFQSGDTQGWRSGSANPNPPTWSADGGPAGAGDGFLRVRGNGSDAAGGNLIAFNVDQWSGDYVAARVGEVRANLRNLGDDDLSIRLLVEGPGGGFYSREAVLVRAGSRWQRATFPLDGASLTGGVDVVATLSGVTKVRLLHAPSSAGVEPIAGELGVDNVAAHSGEACTRSSAGFGLCTAFCHVLACESGDPKGACSALLDRYVHRTGDLPPCIDVDRDGVEDAIDNCPEVANAGQEDADADDVGDVCDNCPVDRNPDQEDTFGAAGVGNACDCPCFTTGDAVAIAVDLACAESFCFESPPVGLQLTGIQCSPLRPDYSVLVAEFTDFGGEALCQLNLPPPEESVVVVGLAESQVLACQDYVFEAAADTGLQCR